MNKSELVDHVAESADISKAAATRAVESACKQSAAQSLATVSLLLVGFGTFLVREPLRVRAGIRRPVRHQIAAAKVPAFKAGKALKDALN